MMKQKSQVTKQSVVLVRCRCESGQAFVEFSLVVVLLMGLAFGLIDFCRAIYTRQIITNLSREAANEAARGFGTTPLEIMSNALDTVSVSASPLNITNTSGLVVITAITNKAGGYVVSMQVKKGKLSAVSNYGTVGTTATIPTMNPPILQPGHTLYIAEIFYKFKAVTPVGKFFGAGMISNNMHDITYFPGG